MLLDVEAKTSASTPEKLTAAAAGQAVAATPAELQSIYNANSTAFNGRSFAEVREELVIYVKQAREQQSVDAYVATLKTKYKPVIGKDVNAAELKPSDILLTIGTRKITVGEFETKTGCSERLRTQHLRGS